ncbi:MAG TPA: hypothetical protein PLZ37_18475 [Nitrospira sp.]|jgi:hypothetical protein|nr:hypothetical protein [Nitrospira sp.]
MLKKTEAIQKLQRQMKAVDAIPLSPSFSPEFKRWKRNTEVAIENIFGNESRHLKDFDDIRFNLGFVCTGMPDSVFDEAFRDGMIDAKAILSSLIQEIEEYWEEEPSPGQRPDTLSRLTRFCDRFHLVARRMRHRYSERPTLEIEDEYDVQDLFHALLAIDFDDIRREEWTPSYAGGSARMDFLLKEEGIVVELKKTRKSLDTKAIGDQLLIDIGRYQVHPDCRMLFCFVYDPEGRIGNPRGLESDLTKIHEKMNVRVIVSPKGL